MRRHEIYYLATNRRARDTPRTVLSVYCSKLCHGSMNVLGSTLKLVCVERPVVSTVQLKWTSEIRESTRLSRRAKCTRDLETQWRSQYSIKNKVLVCSFCKQKNILKSQIRVSKNLDWYQRQPSRLSPVQLTLLTSASKKILGELSLGPPNIFLLAESA